MPIAVPLTTNSPLKERDAANEDVFEYGLFHAGCDDKNYTPPTKKPAHIALENLNCTTAFYKSGSAQAGIITLTGDFKVSATTNLLHLSGSRCEILKKVTKGGCSVNIWISPNSKDVVHMSVNFR